jgi:hypothetical protein
MEPEEEIKLLEKEIASLKAQLDLLELQLECKKKHPELMRYTRRQYVPSIEPYVDPPIPQTGPVPPCQRGHACCIAYCIYPGCCSGVGGWGDTGKPIML